MFNFATSFSRIQTSLRQVLDFAFPPHCALCGSSDFSTDGQNGTYCQACAEELSPPPLNRCLCCGAEIGAYASSDNGCTHCRNRTLRFDSVVCLGMYEGALRKAILSAKWSFSAVRIRSLAGLLAAHRRQELQDLKIDRVIPIPQHWRQRVVRHFNPSWIVGSEVASCLKVPCDPHLLRRQRRTRPQKRVAVSQRFHNQSEAFAMKDAHILEGRRVLLIDDVLTTGATCSAAAKLMKQSGAAAVHVAVLGRVLDHSA